MLPWSYGKPLSENCNSNKAITEANLDFDVIKEQIQTQGGIIHEGKYQTIRTDNGVPLGIVGEVYTILQNVDAFRAADSVLDRVKFTHAGHIGRGERIWLIAKITDGNFVINKDSYDAHIMLTNSHDGTSGLTGTPIAVQGNLTYALSKGFNIRHSSKLEYQMQEGVRILKETIGLFDHYGENLKKMYTQPMTRKEMFKYSQNVLSRVFHLDEPEDYDVTLTDIESYRTNNMPLKRRRYVEAVLTLTNGQEGETKYGAFKSVLNYCNLGQLYRGNPVRRNETRLLNLINGKMFRVQQVALKTLLGD